MPRLCTVCSHARRADIDAALASGASANRRIATRFGLSEAAVRRHKDEHLPTSLVEAVGQETVRQAIDVVAQLRAINGASRQILEEARAAKDGELALKAIDRIHRQVELQA